MTCRKCRTDEKGCWKTDSMNREKPDMSKENQGVNKQ